MIQYFSKSSQLGPLKQIPNLKQTAKIIRISYPHNAIQKISPAIAKAQNTEQIDLSHNKIVIIESIFDLRKLRIINLSNNQIVNVSKGILKLRKLELLDLSFNLLNNMNNINPLFQLHRIRKSQFKFQLQGNKVFETNKQQIDRKIQISLQQIRIKQQRQLNKQQISELQISKSLDLHRRTLSHRTEGPSKQIKKQEQQEKHIQGSLQQNKKRINISNAQLLQFLNKFQVIAASQFKGWNSHMLNSFKQQSKSVISFIEVYKRIISCVTFQFINLTQATSKLQILLIQATQGQQFIKDQHCSFLQQLHEFPDAPMKSYKIWVQLYRELRQLTQRIRFQAWSIIQCQIRHQQIQALKIISPTKMQNTDIVKKNLQLQGLLFSRQKQNKQIHNDVQCSECFIKNEEIRQLKQIVQFLTHQNSQLKLYKEQITVQRDGLVKEEGILGKQLRRRQQQIICALDQRIDASVYQKILLQQAKGIQDLIKCDRHLYRHRNNLDQTQKIGDICQTATALAKDKAGGDDLKNIVSQFTQNQQERYTSKLPYFNKNEYSQLSRRSKRNTQNSATSTEKKKGGNSDAMHKKSQNQRGKNADNSSKARQVSDYSCRKLPSRQISQSSPKMIQNMPNRGNTIISDFALTETGRQQEGKHQMSRKILAEMLNKKRNQNAKIYNNINDKCNKNNINNQLKQKKKGKAQENILVQIRQQRQKYVPIQYHSLNLKDEQSYEDYMKYHLRNSIIETLQRKGKRSSLSKQGKSLGIIEKTVKREKKQSLQYSSRISSNSNIKKIEQHLQGKQIKPTSKSYSFALNKLR